MDWIKLRGLVSTALSMNVRRLTFWIFAAVFVLIALLLYLGKVSFAGMTATGVKLGTNAEYAIAAMLGAFTFFLMHFTATLCGDPVTQDHRLGVAPLLRSSPLEMRTYIIGRFLGGYLSVLAIYAVFVAALILGQLLPADADKLTLPFRIAPYLKHALWFVLIPTFFVGACSFAIGTLTRNTRMVYVFVTSLLVSWLLVVQLMGDAPARWFAYVEPSGLTWLGEVIAKSRGNAWLNENPISADLGFVLNRLALVVIGACALAITVVVYPRTDESETTAPRASWFARTFAWFLGRDRAVEDRYSDWVGHVAVPVVEPAPRGIALWCRQFWSSLVTEARLLLAERSLWIMAPVTMLFAGATIESFEGPFNLPLYPVSSEFARLLVGPLLLFLAGTTIFYTGEVFHRDDSNAVRSIIYATPVPNGALLLAKLTAMIALGIGMSALTVATAIVNQWFRWTISLQQPVQIEFTPYLDIAAHVIVPAVIAMCSIALVVNVVFRGRYMSYFALLALGAACVWWVGIKGHRTLLWNPLLIGHWRYSELTRLEPYELPLRLHHIYWALVLFSALALSTWVVERTQGGWKRYFSPSAIAQRPLPAALTLIAAAGAVAAGIEIQRLGNLRGTESELEKRSLAMEDKYLPELEKPRLSYQRVDVDIRLRPAEGAVDVKGNLTLVNAWPEPIKTAYFTIDPLYEIRRFEISGVSKPFTRDDSVVAFTFDKPLASGERTTMHLDWSGVPHPGFSKNGGTRMTFIYPSTVFLNSFGPEVLPSPGIFADLFIRDEEKRRDLGRKKLAILTDRSGEEFVPSGFDCDSAFDFRARIEAPKPLQVLSVGRPSGLDDLGETRRYTWASEQPLRAFAILAYDYQSVAQGGDQVFFHANHAFNVDTIMQALQDGRRTFGASFLAYPYEQLKIGEFPRIDDFAQSFPTLMPYSESIGFLSNFHDQQSARYVDATYFVTAHEVAHQWWGYLLHPGASLGANVLSESLAEYSAMVLIDQQRGERARLVFIKNEEDRYLRGRNRDKEVPLASLDEEGGVYWYNKGSHVFYMLERRIGREKVLAGLREFVEQWQARSKAAQPSFPTIEDLLATLRRQHQDQNLDWFYSQWFHEVAVPDLKVESAELRNAGDVWSVDFAVSNVGTGRAVVRAEAIAGKWNLDDNEPDKEFRASAPMPLTIEPGQTVQGSLTVPFEPKRLIVDRLYETIDFDRTNNSCELKRAPAPSGLQAGSQNAPPHNN